MFPAIHGVIAGQGGIVVPGAPGTLSLSAGSPADDVINLSWSAPSDTGGGTISGYRIKKDGSVLVADTSSTGTTYSASGLTASTSYSFTVAAINEKGTGADGNTPSLSTGADPAVAWSASGSYSSGTDGSYSWVRWTGSGTFVITSNTTSKTFDQHIVAGAGGGSGYDNAHGGGGGGGSKQFTGQAMANGSHTVTIGAGGTGSAYAALASNGSNSVCGSNSTTGGGGGGGGSGSAGGSGGGGGSYSSYHAAGAGTAGEGNAGGAGQTGQYPLSFAGGGGGGKGAAGGVGYSAYGGIGETMTYTSSSYEVAGGGGSAYKDWFGNWGVKQGGASDGAGTGNDTTNASNQKYGAGNFSQNNNPYGGANTGGGGGSHGKYTTSYYGGTGGSGVVELRWLT